MIQALRHLLILLFLLALNPATLCAQEFTKGNEEVFGQDALNKVQERVRDALQKYEQEGLTVGTAVGRIIRSDGESRSITVKDDQGKQITFQKMPKKNPLLDNDGSENSGKSKEIYTQHDPQAMLHDETVAQCIEDRQVFDGTYLSQCAARCPGGPGGWVRVMPGCPICIPPFLAGCVRNFYYVSELYFPVYQSTTYAGRLQGSFDSTGSYLSGADQNPDLKLSKVKQRYRQEGWSNFEKAYQKYTGEQVEGDIEEHIPKHLWDAEWGGTDRTGGDDADSIQPYHTIVYQTNPHRQMTRNRPKPVYEGYERQKNCFFHTLDDASKKVVSHATYGEKEYMDLQQSAAASVEKAGQLDAQVVSATMIADTLNIFDIAKQTENTNGDKLPEIIQKLEPSQSAGESKWNWLRQGLEHVGIRPHNRTKEAIWYSILAGPYYSNRYNSWATPLYAAYSQAVSQYMVNATPTFSPNRPNLRPLQYSLYTTPEGRGNYTGKLPSVKDPIIFTDKTQILPPYDVGMDKGTHCFRPETLARVEPVKSKKDIDEKAGEYNGLRRDLAKLYPQYGMDGLNAANQVNVAYWIKRVNCYCTQCGVPYGCSVLNGGDHKKENFYGVTELNGSSPVMFIGGSTIPVGPLPNAQIASGIMNSAAGAVQGAANPSSLFSGAAANPSGLFSGAAANMPGVSGLQSLPGMSVPNIPSVPSMPSIPSMPSMPNVPSLPSLPNMSSPSLPSVPSLPSGLPAGGFGSGLFFRKSGVKDPSHSLDFNRLARSGGASVGGPAINIPDWGMSFDESAVSPKGKTLVTNIKAADVGTPGKTGKGTVAATRNPSPSGQPFDWFKLIQLILQGVQLICEPQQGGQQSQQAAQQQNMEDG